MIIILDNIRSLFNVGSIFRTADAVGVEKIYLCGITPTPEDRFGKIRPQLAKVSLGAEKSVAWEYQRSAAKVIDKLKNPPWPGGPTGGGFKIFAVEQSKKSVPYFKIKNVDLKKTALIFGNEVRGISKNVLKRSDLILEIPMSGKKESLNVSVSAGIILFGIKYLTDPKNK